MIGISTKAELLLKRSPKIGKVCVEGILWRRGHCFRINVDPIKCEIFG